jgi:hypothetical protein
MMGYHYQNKLDEEAERRFWAGISPRKRIIYKLLYSLFTALGFVLAFYSTIGWLLLKFF